MNRWARVDDGIVSGRLLRKSHACDVCGEGAACVKVSGYEMPDPVPWERTIISLTKTFHMPVAVYLGISCGCYAKFHRQVAHIKDSMEEGTWPY